MSTNINSVSLIFQSSEGYYLIANENRKLNPWDKKKIPMFFPIGGKVNENENSLVAAVREFIEETEIEIDIEDFYKKIITFEHFKFDDIPVGKKGKYHRFFYFFLNSVETAFIENLLSKITKKNNTLNYLHWYHEGEDLNAISYVSSLLKDTKII